jgi:murein DD-endopeptidase MepM/ murein hydrolase activator NlpD
MPQPTTTPSATASPIPSATATPARRPTASATADAPSARTYVFPVRSKGKVSYGRFHHDYPATDMFCPIGSQFLAVTAGVVDYVSREDVWDPAVNDGATRGGLSVAIVGDDGVRYYGSHLSQVADGIAPGVRVTAGQLLGLTGKSGDARVTDPHLHFGISRPTTPDDWRVRRGEIAPYAYLRAWQRGENVTPKLPYSGEQND